MSSSYRTISLKDNVTSDHASPDFSPILKELKFGIAALECWTRQMTLYADIFLSIRPTDLLAVDRPIQYCDRCEDRQARLPNELVLSFAESQTVLLTDLHRPNLITDLMSVVDQNLQKRYVQHSADPRDAVMLRRSLQLINAILKEFASIKMLNGVKVMAQVSSDPYYSGRLIHDDIRTDC